MGRKTFEYDSKLGVNQIRPELIAYPCLFLDILLGLLALFFLSLGHSPVIPVALRLSGPRSGRRLPRGRAWVS